MCQKSNFYFAVKKPAGEDDIRKELKIFTINSPKICMKATSHKFLLPIQLFSTIVKPKCNGMLKILLDFVSEVKTNKHRRNLLNHQNGIQRGKLHFILSFTLLFRILFVDNPLDLNQTSELCSCFWFVD